MSEHTNDSISPKDAEKLRRLAEHMGVEPSNEMPELSKSVIDMMRKGISTHCGKVSRKGADEKHLGQGLKAHNMGDEHSRPNTWRHKVPRGIPPQGSGFSSGKEE